MCIRDSSKSSAKIKQSTPNEVDFLFKYIGFSYKSLLFYLSLIHISSADGKDFDYGWEQMRKLGVDMVDEHYYNCLLYTSNWMMVMTRISATVST